MPSSSRDLTLPARDGIAIALGAGERLRIINLHGGQVVDMWAVSPADPREHLSMAHTRVALNKLIPQVGDELHSTRRRALLTLVDDTSPGVHDTLIAACDPERYRQLGGAADHPSCAANYVGALAELGVEADFVPAPLNLFMNIPWQPDGTLEFLASPARAGDQVTFAAAVDVIVVLSACPMDLNPINTGGPRDIGLRVLSGPE
jgi:uncharacterized protein YcgI (DUF1989 family)